MHTLQADVLFASRSELSEGPVWDEQAERLAWVDIPSGVVHCSDLDGSGYEAFTVGANASAAALRGSGGFVVATRAGFAILDNTGLTYLPTTIGISADTRMNDGKCDASGRFWAGRLTDDFVPGRGSLLVLEPSGEARIMLDDLTLPNGMGWSPDNRWMYFIDSRTWRIDRFVFDLDTGRLGKRSAVVEMNPSDGNPDGMTVDADGCLWVALYGAGVVRRYTPNGALDCVVHVPTPHVTSCTFAGPKLDKLVVTARRPADAEEGLLYVCEPGATGLPAARFAG